jgi:predicted metal-dependent phosphoesterase TrpH
LYYYRYDTHVHTKEVSPCGKVPAEEIVRLYNKAGFQGFFVTDHYYNGFVDKFHGSWEEVTDNYLAGYRKAKRAGHELGMDILLGMELRFDGSVADYLVYGFDEEFLYNNPYLNRHNLTSFRELIKNETKPILVFQAHPFRQNMPPVQPELLDGIEAFNCHPRHDSSNNKAYALGLSHGLYLSAGSDAHQMQDVGRGGIGITRRIKNSHDYVDLFLSGSSFDILFKH